MRKSCVVRKGKSSVDPQCSGGVCAVEGWECGGGWQAAAATSTTGQCLPRAQQRASYTFLSVATTTLYIFTQAKDKGCAARSVDLQCYICGYIVYIYTYIVEKSTIFGKILYQKRGLDFYFQLTSTRYVDVSTILVGYNKSGKSSDLMQATI